MNDNDSYKVTVPEGTSGKWRVERFTVTPEQAQWNNLRAAISAHERTIRAGTYTRLMHAQQIVMSDTPAEFEDHAEFIRRAKGRVLIAGLGLGMVLKAVLAKPVVKHITVVEKSPDVLKLVAPTYQHDPRLTFVQADIYHWVPPTRYDVAWFDVWTEISTDDLREMTQLRTQYTKVARWRDCWGRALLLERWAR